MCRRSSRWPETALAAGALVVLVGLFVALPTAAYAQTSPAPTTPPATPPATTTPVVPLGPAPFPMPMDTGPKMMAQAAQARVDLATLQPQLASATTERDELQKRWDQLTAQIVHLDDLRSQTVAELQAAKERLGQSAARAYKQSGGGRLNAALDAMSQANDMLDASRDMHLISTYGDYELNVVAQLEQQKKVARQADPRRLEAARDGEGTAGRSVVHVDTLTTQINTANQNLFVAQTALASFKDHGDDRGQSDHGSEPADRAATRRLHPEQRLHAAHHGDDRRARVVLHRRRCEARHPRRCRLRPVDHRDRRLQLLREHGRGRRQQLRRHRRLRLLPPRLHLPRRPHRRAGPAPTVAGVRRSRR